MDAIHNTRHRVFPNMSAKHETPAVSLRPSPHKFSAASSSFRHTNIPHSLNPISTPAISSNSAVDAQNDLMNGIQMSDGAFLATCEASIFIAACASSLHPTIDGSSDSGGVCDEQYDPADVTDADAFELLQGASAPANPNRPAVDDAIGTQEDAPQQPDQAEPDEQPDTVDQETASGVIVDRFPFGSAGDPIPGKVQGVSAYESQREMHADTPWAPFFSQLDWKVAQWAKIRS